MQSESQIREWWKRQHNPTLTAAQCLPIEHVNGKSDSHGRLSTPQQHPRQNLQGPQNKTPQCFFIRILHLLTHTSERNMSGRDSLKTLKEDRYRLWEEEEDECDNQMTFSTLSIPNIRNNFLTLICPSVRQQQIIATNTTICFIQSLAVLTWVTEQSTSQSSTGKYQTSPFKTSAPTLIHSLRPQSERCDWGRQRGEGQRGIHSERGGTSSRQQATLGIHLLSWSRRTEMTPSVPSHWGLFTSTAGRCCKQLPVHCQTWATNTQCYRAMGRF